MDDLDELERRAKAAEMSDDPKQWAYPSAEVLALISRCRRAEERSLYFQRQVDALKLQLDCLNAAMREGDEAERELGKDQT